MYTYVLLIQETLLDTATRLTFISNTPNFIYTINKSSASFILKLGGGGGFHI